MKSPLTQQRLKELLHYDPETGVFTWRVTKGSTAQAGSSAGVKPNSLGYRIIRIDYTLYSSHRLAWLYVHGEWPPQQIDHINGLRHDNRLSNLRLASSSQNLVNCGPRANNKSRLKGVSRNPPGWMARIRANGRQIHLGTFATPEEAHAAYAKAAHELHGEFARTA